MRLDIGFIFVFLFSAIFLPKMILSHAQENHSPDLRLPEPSLTFKSSDMSWSYKRSELLLRKDRIQLEIEDDPAYPGRTMIYSAVPLMALLKGITLPQGAVLQYQCVDGFSAPISPNKLLSGARDRSIPYIAIEPEVKKWPPLNPPTDLKTAGPFYLVWTQPKLSKIAREEWPYQLTRFEVKKSVGESYPQILPAAGLPENHVSKRGFQVFMRDCFMCHTMNLQGESKLGPDLNVPMNPVEYLTPLALKTVIRNPQALRVWPLSKMHGFPKEQLSDLELNDLITYLEHMSHRKVKIPDKN